MLRQLGQFFLEVGLLLANVSRLLFKLDDAFSEAVEGTPGEKDGLAKVLLEPRAVCHFDSVFYLGEANGKSDVDLVDLEQFFFLVGLKVLFGVSQRN